MQFPKGLEVDAAGNVNQDQGWSHWKKPVLISAAIAAATLATMGAAGVFSGAAAGAGGGAGAGAGAGTAAAASAAPAAVAAAHAGSWLAPVLGTVVPAAAGVVGSVIASRANSAAARTEAEFNQRALDAAVEEQKYQRGFSEEARDYNRTRFNDYARGLDVYRTAGADALGRETGALANSRYQPQLGPQLGPQAPSDVPRSAEVPVQAPAAQSAMITVISPTGEQQQRPARERAHWEEVARRTPGAQVVG